MIGRVLRSALRLASWCPGYLPAVRRFRSRDVAIVMYHGVTSSDLPVFNCCQLSVRQFEQEIEFLAETYTVLPLVEIVERLRNGGSLPTRVASVTFDDCFRNVYTTAYPILARYGVPVTGFVVTSLVGTRQPAWPERVYHALASTRSEALTFDQVRWPLLSRKQRAAAYRGIISDSKGCRSRTGTAT